MIDSRIDVRPISGNIGAEIHGVNIAANPSDEIIAQLRQALVDHCVIFFRDQKLDMEQHIQFTRRFGEMFIHPNHQTLHPGVLDNVREPGDERIVGEDWHADTTMMAEPPMGAILYASEVPTYSGDTCFANQYLAYETLSEGLKRTLETLRAVHTDRMSAGPQAARNSKRATKVREDAEWRPTVNTHPVVCTHPESGRRYLFVNSAYSVGFEGWSEAESKPLLDYLLMHGHRPEFTCRFRWEKGSVAFWDNRSTNHIAIHDARKFRRVMRRTQIAGTKPVLL